MNLTPAAFPHRPELPPGPYVCLSVSDTGSGMDEKTMDHIFDPFYTAKGVGEGTGLGLAVVHGIVESHHGMITVESKVGAGTAFHVFLPAIQNGITEEQPEGPVPLPIGTERILFVDDEKSLAELAGMILERQGYTVIIKTDSADALEIFRSNPEGFDLVITDQAMPDMSGAELAVELLKIRRDLPILLCTGHSEKISAKKAKEIDIREFCVKPLDMRSLAMTVRKILDENKV